MRAKPSRIFFALIALLLLSNGLWAWCYMTTDETVQARDSVLVDNQRTIAQFRQLATASMSGRPLKEVEPALQKIFPGVPTQITKDPRTYVIGNVVLLLDDKDNITGVATFAP